MINSNKHEKLIPERLREFRENMGISKAEAARRLNLSKMGYGRYESGEREPSPQMIQVIAEGMGTSVAYLTGMSDDPSNDKIVIYRNETPELFVLVENCRSSDDEMIKRMLAYYKMLAERK